MGSPGDGVIWLADPRDIANRQEVVRLSNKEITWAALSPNGKQVALTAGSGPERSLWVVNLDGTGLQELAPRAGPIIWGQDSHTIFYVTYSSVYTPEEPKWMGVEQVDLVRGETRQILKIEQAEPILELLGWSAGGQWLYHVRRNPETREFEVWKTRQDGSTSQIIVSLGTDFPDYLLLSPNGDKLLLGTYQDLRWISTDGQDGGNVTLPQPDGYQVLWDHGENEVILGQYDASQPLYHLYAVNIQSQHTRELATIAGGSFWDLLGFSPDYQWLMTSPAYQTDFYWVHLPTEARVPVPRCPSCAIWFVGWVSNAAEH